MKFARLNDAIKMEPAEPCCDNWPMWANHFDWHLSKFEGQRYRVMAHAKFGTVQLRVVHCPSCGEYVRDIEILVEEEGEWDGEP